MNLTTKKTKSKAPIKDDFSVDENESIDLCGFSDGEAQIEGTLLKTFSFDSSTETEAVEVSITSPAPASIEVSNSSSSEKLAHSFEDKEIIFDHRTLKANPNGRTPSVDGEAFDMVRCYTLRRSTVRILSKIKAIHTDDNVYLNTIVDEAIRYYYDYLIGNNK